MGIAVGNWWAPHCAGPTDTDLNSLAKWFESNRAYQVCPLKETSLQDFRELAGNFISSGSD